MPATGAALGEDGLTSVAGSFAYVYYVGSSASGTPLSALPINAGTYTVVATFTSSNSNYTSGGTAQATYTISPASIIYTIGNDAQIFGYPANLAADLPSSFNTGINGETLDITYSSGGDTSVATAGIYAITGVISSGVGIASNYAVTLTNGSLTVLGSGVSVVGTELWIIGGPTSNDNVQVNPVGASATGSTGVHVQATLNGVNSSTTYTQSFTAINIVLYAGNDNVQLAPTLTIKAKISAGNGNDNVQLDAGNSTATLGNGNDNVQAGNGNNTITAGSGNDNVVLGGGTNVVTLGGGNDNVNAGNGNNTIIAGNGCDNISLGYGSNVVTLGGGNDNVNAGLGNNTVTLGNGNDNVSLGSGANTVMVGNGNDNINAGNGNNVISEGNGNDNISAGNGDNLIVAGLGQHNVNVGNGSNILIDGSVQLTQSGDTLGQVLADWIQYGNQAANVASIRSRMHVTFNTNHANNINAGGGLDWFWATYAADHINSNSADLRN
jgi:Ca2+-binding RTX toxin-like protein